MATTLTENFETGPSGATLDSTNTSATAFSGAAATFAGSAIEGSLCARFVTSAASSIARFESTPATTQWWSFYFKVAALPPAGTYVGSWSGTAGEKIIDFRIDPDGKMVVRDNFTAAVTSTAIITAGVWHRMALRLTRNTQMQLRLYIGANRHGSTPDFNGTGTSTVDIAAGRPTIGVQASGTIDISYDRIRVDNVAEPESMTPEASVLPTPVLTVTPTHPTVYGGTGQFTATWPAVPGAASYKVSTPPLPGSVTTGTPTGTTTVTGTTYTWTAQPAGTQTVTVQAFPA